MLVQYVTKHTWICIWFWIYLQVRFSFLPFISPFYCRSFRMLWHHVDLTNHFDTNSRAWTLTSARLFALTGQTQRYPGHILSARLRDSRTQTRPWPEWFDEQLFRSTDGGAFTHDCSVKSSFTLNFLPLQSVLFQPCRWALMSRGQRSSCLHTYLQEVSARGNVGFVGGWHTLFKWLIIMWFFFPLHFSTTYFKENTRSRAPVRPCYALSSLSYICAPKKLASSSNSSCFHQFKSVTHKTQMNRLWAGLPLSLWLSICGLDHNLLSPFVQSGSLGTDLKIAHTV